MAATANEIAEIASGFGYDFSGNELKAISKENISGIKIKHQDTSPSYSFGEKGWNFIATGGIYWVSMNRSRSDARTTNYFLIL